MIYQPASTEQLPLSVGPDMQPADSSSTCLRIGEEPGTETHQWRRSFNFFHSIRVALLPTRNSRRRNAPAVSVAEPAASALPRDRAVANGLAQVVRRWNRREPRGA
jgi:hypothetical protein